MHIKLMLFLLKMIAKKLPEKEEFKKNIFLILLLSLITHH